MSYKISYLMVKRKLLFFLLFGLSIITTLISMISTFCVFVYVGRGKFMVLMEKCFMDFLFYLQEAELKAKSMEEEIGILQKKLEERNEQIQASASSAVKV